MLAAVNRYASSYRKIHGAKRRPANSKPDNLPDKLPDRLRDVRQKKRGRLAADTIDNIGKKSWPNNVFRNADITKGIGKPF